MVNTSTGFSSFQLKLEFSSHVLLPLYLPLPTDMLAKDLALCILQEIELNYLEAIDNLIMFKINHANIHCLPKIKYKVGDKMMLLTANWQRKYIQKKDSWVAKFMLR